MFVIEASKVINQSLEYFCWSTNIFSSSARGSRLSYGDWLNCIMGGTDGNVVHFFLFVFQTSLLTVGGFEQATFIILQLLYLHVPSENIAFNVQDTVIIVKRADASINKICFIFHTFSHRSEVNSTWKTTERGVQRFFMSQLRLNIICQLIRLVTATPSPSSLSTLPRGN